MSIQQQQQQQQVCMRRGGGGGGGDPSSQRAADAGALPPQRKGAAALALSCISAAAAETATYPIDAIKTQLQLQYSSTSSSSSSRRSSAKPAGAFQLARKLVQTHGISGLYAGLTPAVLRHFFYTGTRITLYEQLKHAYAAHGQQHRHSTTDPAAAATAAAAAATTGSELLPKLLFGLTGGAVGQLVAVPADLIKVQMQADVRAVASGRRQQRQYSSVRSVASALVKQQQQGVSGLWKGGLPAVQRAALVNLGELSTYDSAKQAILKARLLPPGLPTHLAASICSGLVSALISTPADVIKTRLMAQAVGPNQQQLQPQRPQQQTPVQPGAAAGAAAAQQQASGPASPQHTSSRLYSSTAARSAGVCSSTGHSHMQCGADASHAAAVGSEPARRGGRWMLQQQQSVNAMSSRAGSVPVMPHYNGMLDCAVQTVRQEGLLALYKGFWPTWARLGPWQLVFWVTYEQLRSAADISAF